MNRQLHDWLRRWPKIDLHRHLEGTVRFETARTLAQRTPDLAGLSRDELRAAVQFDGQVGFAHFLSKFTVLRRLYVSRDAIEQVAREAVEDAAADAIRYLELRFSPEHFAERAGFSKAAVTDWILTAANAAAEQTGITVRYVLTIGRGYTPDAADEILATALRERHRGIVGLDLAGDELEYPKPPFAQHYARAREEGLGITIHAGEAGGPDHVWEAIETYSAQRIGHGIRSVDDPTLLQELRERGVPLEVCLTSNVQTGCVNSLSDHQLMRLWRARVPLVLCSDDPSISGITLTDEWVHVVTEVGLSMEALAESVRRAVEHAFLTKEEKDRLRGTLVGELGTLLTNVPVKLRRYTELGETRSS